MWYPPPPLLVPCYLEPSSCSASDLPATLMWQFVPFDQYMCFAMNEMSGSRNLPISVEDGRLFLLRRSVFDLVKVSRCLELTDPKLLGWYLSQPAEDRKLIQEEGGFLNFLQRHPALEVTRHYIHLKYQVLGKQITPPATMSSKPNKFCGGASECLNCGASYASGAKYGRCWNITASNLQGNVCALEEETPLGLLPNSVKEELNLITATRYEASGRRLNQVATENPGYHGFGGACLAQACAHQQEVHTSKAKYLSQLWDEETCNDETGIRVYKDPSAQASYFLDMELEKQCHPNETNLGNVHNLNQETLPEYYSLNSTGLEQCSNVTESQEPSCSDSLQATKGSTGMSTDGPVESSLASGAENCAFPDSASCHSSEWTDYTEDNQDVSNEEDSGCEPKSDEYHSLVDDVSSPVALSSQLPSSRNSVNPGWSESRRVSTSEESFLSLGTNKLNVRVELQRKIEAAPVPLSVNKAVDVSSDFRACFTTNRSTEISHNCFEKLCRDAATGTDLVPLNNEQETKTIQMSTSEKGTITEVHMSDLDVVCEEFEYLKRIEMEHNNLKEKMARSGPRNPGASEYKGQQRVCGCDCLHRAKRAELRLLALQFAMCQQHCWRCFYTSSLGESALQGAKALPKELFQTLKTLEDDYLEMKRKILEGIHLDNLEPLSVDVCSIITVTNYSPALVFKDNLGDVPTEEAPRSESYPEDLDQCNQANQDNATASSESQGAISKRCRAVCVLDQQTAVSRDARPGGFKESSCTEDWFDAQEELGSASQGCKEEKQAGLSDRENPVKISQKDDRNGSTDQGSLLCVTDFPSNVTQNELLRWFERYNAKQVSLATFSNNRAAIVGVSSPCDAEAAVREMNGRSIQGHTVRVEHIHRSPAGCQGPIKAPRAECVPAACKAATVEEGQSTQGSKRKTHFCKPLRSSLDKLINVCDEPTASGTYVPQHYATMGSFETLMARLTEQHPGVSRERIVAALLELRAKHRGNLSGLPLRAISDMTSDLLAQPSTTV
uniref:RNA binding motif protein 44 n=1 Tax=Astyanax mexicanus TaxID=7994 RepID=A0A3B1K4J8_ASTMX